MKLAAVVATSSLVAGTRSRKKKITALADVLGRAKPDEIETLVGLLVGEPRQGRVGVGYAAVYRLDVPPAAKASLEIREIDSAVDRISSSAGPGSQKERREILEGVFARATTEEQQYLRRLLTGELRQGALAGVMSEAIAVAADVDADAVRRASMLSGDLGATARLALTEGEPGLGSVGLEIMRAVQPMLAPSAPSVEAALESLGEASVEWKLDGARIQVHREGEDIRVFTRNLNDVTVRLPHVVSAVGGLEVSSIVLDGEALSLDESGDPSVFQETMSRFGADTNRDDVPLQAFFFDVLHLDGEDVIDRPLSARLEILRAVVPERMRVPGLITSDPIVAAGVFEEARDRGHEGVMIKGSGSTYEAGRRGSAWVKVKPAHTVDLAVLAAEWGHGRRTGWLSNLHLGALDPEGGGFVMLGKTFKGLTDEMLGWQTARLLELEERRTDHVVYVRPELVVEIAFDGIQRSTRYEGGMALRFARVKRYREDKGPADVETVDAVRAILEGRG